MSEVAVALIVVGALLGAATIGLLIGSAWPAFIATLMFALVIAVGAGAASK